MGTTSIRIDNTRADQNTDLYVMMTADSSSGVEGITVGQSTCLADIPAQEIGFTTAKTARLYIGTSTFDGPPTPDGTLYFGWIEFTKTSATDEVWINLSNVDMSGLPLALSGTQTSGKGFSLGYQLPMTAQGASPSLLKSLETIPISQNAFVTCQTGQVKVVGPTVDFASYPSFDAYIKSLAMAEAPLTLRSDTPTSGSALTFTGSFRNAQAPTNIILSLTSDTGDTFELESQWLTSQIVYQCDGGSILYNGQKLPQNRTAKNDPNSTADERTITNSSFRNLMIGMNEGYLTPTGPNSSINFSGQVPFATGQGNAYAKVLHEHTNSYGFPYADSNLKVLITADPDAPITLTLLADDKAGGYSSDPTPVQPDSGIYQFGIGGGSSSLGDIAIDIWAYPPNASGAYGGFLPDLTDWTKMSFSGAGTDKYVWIKNGAIDTGNCLASNRSGRMTART